MKLKKQVSKNSYYQIDQHITEHPEFKDIKESAKKKILDRVNMFREKRKSGSVGPGYFDGGTSMFSPSPYASPERKAGGGPPHVTPLNL